MMVSCIAIVPHARLHMHPLQECFLVQSSQAEGHWMDLVLVKASAHRFLQWKNCNNLLQGWLIADHVPQVTITTDSSLSG